MSSTIRQCLPAIDPVVRQSVLAFEHGVGRLGDAGSGVPGGDRRRGALRRHGPFRPQADPGCAWSVSCCRRSLLNYFGQGAWCSPTRRRSRTPSTGSRRTWAAAAAGRAGDRGDGDREPGGDHRGLFAHPAGGAARSAAALRDPPHLGVARRTDLHAARELAAPGRRDDAGAVVPDLERRWRSAYGIAVTATMVVDWLLAFIVFRLLWRWRAGAPRGGDFAACRRST